MKKQASPNIVYVVMASVEYEGSSTVRAFVVRSAAEQFAQLCRDYSANERPQCPAMDAPDAEWDAYYEANTRWQKEHPAGEEYYADSFWISEVPLESPQAEAAVVPVGDNAERDSPTRV